MAPSCLCQFPKAPPLRAGVIVMCFLSALIIHRNEHLVWLVSPSDEILYNADVWLRSLPVNGAFVRTLWTHRKGKILDVLGFTLLLPQFMFLSEIVQPLCSVKRRRQLTRCYNVLLWLPRIDWSRSPHRSAGGSWSAPTQCTWWNVELVRSLPLCVPLQYLDLKHRNSEDEVWFTERNSADTVGLSFLQLPHQRELFKSCRKQQEDFSTRTPSAQQINKKDLVSETLRFTARISLSIIIWS